MTAEIPELRLYLAIVFVRLANKLDAVTMADSQILLDHYVLMMTSEARQYTHHSS